MVSYVIRNFFHFEKIAPEVDYHDCSIIEAYNNCHFRCSVIFLQKQNINQSL